MSQGRRRVYAASELSLPPHPDDLAAVGPFDWLVQVILVFHWLRELILVLDWLLEAIPAFDWLVQLMFVFRWLLELIFLFNENLYSPIIMIIV